MAGDEELVRSQGQSKANFILVFSGPFDDQVMQAENSNRAFYERFLPDDDFRSDVVRGVGEESHRRHGGEQDAA